MAQMVGLLYPYVEVIQDSTVVLQSNLSFRGNIRNLRLFKQLVSLAFYLQLIDQSLLEFILV